MKRQTEVTEVTGQCSSLLCAKNELYNIALNSFPDFMTIVSDMKPVQNTGMDGEQCIWKVLLTVWGNWFSFI